jgi:hypothetical protein
MSIRSSSSSSSVHVLASRLSISMPSMSAPVMSSSSLGGNSKFYSVNGFLVGCSGVSFFG